MFIGYAQIINTKFKEIALECTFVRSAVFQFASFVIKACDCKCHRAIFACFTAKNGLLSDFGERGLCINRCGSEEAGTAGIDCEAGQVCADIGPDFKRSE